MSSVSCECVYLCIQAQIMLFFKKSEEAKRLLTQALAQVQFPACSYFLVIVSQLLGRSDFKQASTIYAKVLQVFLSHFSQSNTTHSHFKLINRFNRDKTGITSLIYKGLLPFYSAQFPQSLALTRCLFALTYSLCKKCF